MAHYGDLSREKLQVLLHESFPTCASAFVHVHVAYAHVGRPSEPINKKGYEAQLRH